MQASPQPAPLRIGISMRVVEAENYDEPRDALAHDWAIFMKRVLPDIAWLPIPNLGGDTKQFLRSWGINGLILTGGNDLATSPLRDESEDNILSYALENNYPLLGVCRGLQFLVDRFSGTIAHDDSRSHAGTEHIIRVTTNQLGIPENTNISVNSYHKHVITNAGTLHAFAFDEKGNVEAIDGLHKKLAGIMWHPERYDIPKKMDIALIRNLFGYCE